MACVSPIKSHLIEDKGPGTREPSAKDLAILEKPYAKAVLEFIDRQDLIIRAARQLQAKGKPSEQLTAEAVFMEVDKLLKLEKEKPHIDHYDSDGMSTDDNSSEEGDLETDCVEPEYPEKIKDVQPGKSLTFAPVSGTPDLKNPPNSNGLTAQKRKLQELLKENKRLKRKQKCLKCKENSVSITFLPCGHCSFCYDCGQTYDTCPICFKTILADVKTFLG